MERPDNYRTYKVPELNDDILKAILSTYARLHAKYWHSTPDQRPKELSAVNPFENGIGILAMCANALTCH